MRKLKGGKSNGKQWSILHHNGPMFAPEYKSHNIPIIYKGEEIKLNIEAEELATYFAKYIHSDYYKNPKFKKNFFIDFKEVLPYSMRTHIDDFDFSLIKRYLDKETEKKKEMSKEEKQKIKNKLEKESEPYKYCYIDGAQQEVGNFRLEPPGIFLGRGSHPKIGRVKKRIQPEDITINISKDAKIPTINLNGKHRWGKIINDNNAVWLVSWKDDITGKTKYIFTSMNSVFKSKSDEDKFDLAKKLKNKVSSIRKDYEAELLSSQVKYKQLATALYFIDHLALRVGGKKDSKEEADTVGVTSLRVEHITLIPPLTIKLDFLGKDSVRFCKKVNVIKDVYDNLTNFIKGKKKKDELFDLITASTLNEYLNGFLSGLTAKVWRTYNASVLFQKELNKVSQTQLDKLHEDEKLNYLISVFNQANTAVALLCNHQKNVSSNLDGQIDKYNEQIKKLQSKKIKLKKSKSKSKTEKLNKIASKIKIIKMKKDTKLMMKNVSLGTSKMNYIDPRIIFAFIKKYNIPKEKIFNDKLLTRFKWASDVKSNYKF